MLRTVRSNLPEPDYIKFVGRDEEFRTLKKKLSSKERLFIIALQGMGGIGKTALALEICSYFQREHKNLPSDDKYDFIVWTSAKVDDMTSSGRTPRPASKIQATRRAILSKIIEVMELGKALTIDEDRQESLVLDALANNRVLLVIDSFEQLESNVSASVIEFLKEIPAPSKILATTRPQQTIPVSEQIYLNGLNENEGLLFIRQLYEKLGQNQTSLNEAELRQIYEVASGVPLVIKWGLERILTLNEPYSSVISQLKKGAVDLSEYCVSDSFEAVKGRKAEEIALVLLPLRDPVSRQMIGALVDLGKEVRIRDEELNLLLALQLIVRSRDDKFKLAPLAQAYLLSQQVPDKLNQVREQWARHYYDFITAFVGKHGRVEAYLDKRSKIWPEVENIVEILEAISVSNPQLYCDLLESMRYILYIRGDWVGRDNYMQLGIEAASKSADYCREALFASDIAWIAAYRGKLESAQRFYQSAEQALNKCSDPYYRAKFYIDLARFYHLNSPNATSITEAETIYLKGLEETAKVTSTPVIRSTCLYYLGLLYYDMGNKGEAKKQFKEGQKLAALNNATREADRHHSMLALLLADNGQYLEAKKIFERIIVNAEAAADFVRVADYRFSLAKIEYKAGNRPGAQTLLTEAERIYNLLGRNQDVNFITQFRHESGLVT